MMATHRHGKAFRQGIAALVTVILVSTGRGEILVDWGGNTVTSSRDLHLPTNIIDVGQSRIWPYSFDVPISPVYEYGSTENSTSAGPPFYGAIQNIDGTFGPIDLTNRRMENVGDIDELRIWGSIYDSARNYLLGLIFFKPTLKAHQTVRMRDGDCLSLTYTRTSSGFARVRMALLNGDTWYLSSTNVGASTTFTVDNPNEHLWGAWDAASTNLTDVGVTFDVPGTTLKNIRAFGFYFHIARTSAGSGPRMNATAYSANLTVQPHGTLLTIR